MPHASLTWTESTVGDSIIVSYDLYRSQAGGDFALLQSFPVVRDDFGAITSQTLDYIDPDVDGGVLYTYRVLAVDANSRSANSNELPLTTQAVCLELLESGDDLLLETGDDVLLEICEA